MIFFFFLLSMCFTFSQTPGINYQALILNTTTIEIPGTDVSENQIPLGLEEVTFRFSISNVNEIEYIEEQTVTTDENGLVSLIVGEGAPTYSTFNNILWDGKLKYLGIEINVLKNNEGFIQFDSQKILYIPHPQDGHNIGFVKNEGVITPPYVKGDLIWVEEYKENKNPTLVIWDGRKWMPVVEDYDPTNELSLIVVTDVSDRAVKFPQPKTGDQLWNQACNCIEVYDGNNWVSLTNSFAVLNGVYKDEDKIKLGGDLIEPTTITTTNSNTLAIKGLEEKNDINNNIVVVEPTSGILKRSSASSLIKKEEAIFLANDGQLQFLTPQPITDIEKIDVYRNGVKIDFTKIDSKTIELEKEATCYKNDKIRIVQLH